MSGLVQWLLVAALGGLGALMRFRVDGAVSARWPGDFPMGTLLVNLSGAFALGLLAGGGASDGVLLVVGAGLLGGYTTFSTWMFESQRLVENGAWMLMWLNLLGSLAAGGGATALGWLIGAGLK